MAATKKSSNKNLATNRKKKENNIQTDGHKPLSVATSFPQTREWYRTLIDAIQEEAGRAIVYPEVPRARHRAYSGITINGGVQYNLFRDHVLALTTDYHFEKEELERSEAVPGDGWDTHTHTLGPRDYNREKRGQMEMEGVVILTRKGIIVKEIEIQ